MKVLRVYIVIFALILLDITLINNETRAVCHTRIGINFVNAFPIVGVMLFYERRKTKTRYSWVTIVYFLSFWCAFILDAASCGTVDYEPYDDSETSFNSSADLLDEPIQSDESILARLLRPKPKDKDPGVQYSMLPPEQNLKQSARIFYVILVLTGLVRLLSKLQIYEDLSFLIKMIQTTLNKLIPFATLFFGLIIGFQFAMTAMNTPLTDVADNNDYANIDITAFEKFIYVFRMALGDFQVAGFKREQQGVLILTWIVWIILVCINSIIFLNFLIAVVSDVFAQVMQTRTEECYQKRAEILSELFDVFGTLSDENAKDKPSKDISILVTRQCAYSDHDNWGGLVAEIKHLLAESEKGFKTSTEKVEITLSQQNEKMSKSIDEKLTVQLKGITNQISYLSKTVESLYKDVQKAKDIITVGQPAALPGLPVKSKLQEKLNMQKA